MRIPWRISSVLSPQATNFSPRILLNSSSYRLLPWILRDPDAAARIASRTKGLDAAISGTDASGSSPIQGKWHNIERNATRRLSAEARLKEGWVRESGLWSVAVVNAGEESELWRVFSG
jgi:hypothetical protein